MASDSFSRTRMKYVPYYDVSDEQFEGVTGCMEAIKRALRRPEGSRIDPEILDMILMKILTLEVVPRHHQRLNVVISITPGPREQN